MLFVARCLDRFTKENGRLAFLIPFTVYKTQAGAGFREFLAKGYWKDEKANSPCKVLKIHDLVTLYPFEGAVNRTSLVVIEKSGKTEFPIPCVMWHNPRSKGVNQEDALEEIRKLTKQFDLVFIPLENKPENPWMQIAKKAYEGIKKVIGSSPWYEAHEGVKTALNHVYWIQILSEQPDGLLITNPPLSGQKKKVKQVKQIVEKDLVYPLARGKDIKKWYVKSNLDYILFPIKDGKTIPSTVLKTKYPKTYEYFLKFFKELINRKGGFYESKLKIYKEKPIEQAEKMGPPFYYLSQVTYSLTPYKVVWKAIAGAITGKFTEFATAVLPPMEKTIIPDAGLMLVGVESLDEAHYLSAILNSSIINLTIASYSYELGGYTHILDYVKIPKFDSNNSLHQKLSQLSRKAHEIAKKIYEENREDLKEDLKRIEEEIDRTVAKLYGITNEELKEIRKCLMILKEGEIPEEEKEIEKEEVTILTPKNIEVTIEPLLVNEGKPEKLKVKIVNPLENLSNMLIEIFLGKRVLLREEIEEIKKGQEKILEFELPKLKAGQYKLISLLHKNKELIKNEKTLFVKSQKAKKKIKAGKFYEELEKILGENL